MSADGRRSVETEGGSGGRRLAPVGDVELDEDVCDVGTDGARTEEEGLGDLFVGLVPVVILLPRDRYFQKTLGNLKEVESRGGKVIILTDEKKFPAEISAFGTLTVPKASHFLTPIVLSIPLQLLAYHIAVHRGTDVDQPRNLAKSVTVE